MDHHSQSLAMHTAELDLAANHTGMDQVLADGSSEEPTPATGAPPPGSTTHRITTCEDTKVYQAQAWSEAFPTCTQPFEQCSSTASQARDSDNKVD